MFIIPEIISADNSIIGNVFFRNEKKKGQYFCFPHIQPDHTDENNFWTDMLNEVLDEAPENLTTDYKALDFKIYSRVHFLLKERTINLYSAIRYFWNRLVYYKSLVSEDELASNYERMKLYKVEFSLNGNIVVEPPHIILPSNVQKIPLILVPNLVCFLNEHYLRRNRHRNYNLMFRNNFKELLKYSYPKIRIPSKKISKNKIRKKKLQEEYRDRKINSQKDDDFINSKMLIELIKQLNIKQKKQAFRFLKKL